MLARTTWLAVALIGTITIAAAAPSKPAPSKPARIKPTVSRDPALGFERYRLANGLEVILAPDRAVPLVAVDVWYHVGTGHENHGKSGFAHLFEHMMLQGSRHVGEDKHFAILRSIGVGATDATTNLDRTNYFEVVPANQLEVALWLESDRMGWLLDRVTQASLDNQIAVVRNERRQRIEDVAYGKALIAQYRAMYPEGHPYRHLWSGKHEDLEAASLDDVKAFFKTWYVPANATLAIAGDFSAARVKQLVDKWFATLPVSSKPVVVDVPAPVIKATEIVITDDSFAKLPQVVFAWHAPPAYAAGQAELTILAEALSRDGGRLSKALTYDRALAQRVTAEQYGMRFSGVFQITVTLRDAAEPTDAIHSVKQIVQRELARAMTEPLSINDIQRVVAANELGAYRQLETVLDRAELLQDYNHYLGDPDKLSWDLDRYRTTTVENIRGYAVKYLAPEHMVTVVTIPMTAGTTRSTK